LKFQKLLQSGVHGMSGISNMHYTEVWPSAQQRLATHQGQQHVIIPHMYHESARPECITAFLCVLSLLV